MISVVAGKNNGWLRQLPQLYLGPIPIFGAWDLNAIREHLERLLTAVAEAGRRQPVYLLTASEIDGRRGLYAVDRFNRSAYRRALERLGMKFAEHPYLRLSGKGVFESDSWNAFKPSFIILPADRGDVGHRVVRAGELLFRLAAWRLGLMRNDELSLLAYALQGIDGVAADDPEIALRAIV